MNSILKLIAGILASTILLWFAAYTFLYSTNIKRYGITPYKATSDQKLRSEQPQPKQQTQQTQQLERAQTGQNAQSTQSAQSAQSAQSTQSTQQAQISTDVRAIEILLSTENSINCTSQPTRSLFFRENSIAIRGASYLVLDELIQMHKKCDNSIFIVNSNETNESAVMLGQRRQDEVKYYLSQRSVDKSAITLDLSTRPANNE